MDLGQSYTSSSIGIIVVNSVIARSAPECLKGNIPGRETLGQFPHLLRLANVVHVAFAQFGSNCPTYLSTHDSLGKLGLPQQGHTRKRFGPRCGRRLSGNRQVHQIFLRLSSSTSCLRHVSQRCGRRRRPTPSFHPVADMAGGSEFTASYGC